MHAFAAQPHALNACSPARYYASPLTANCVISRVTRSPCYKWASATFCFLVSVQSCEAPAVKQLDERVHPIVVHFGSDDCADLEWVEFFV
jgi:hypothetical protein